MEGGRPPIPPRQDLPGKDTAAFEGLDDYIKLMQQCWAQEPEERPSIGRVIEGLRCVLGALGALGANVVSASRLGPIGGEGKWCVEYRAVRLPGVCT